MPLLVVILLASAEDSFCRKAVLEPGRGGIKRKKSVIKIKLY